MAISILEYLQPSMDRYILKMMDPRSKITTMEQKERIRKKLEEKRSGVWDRKKARLRSDREKRKIRAEDNS